MSELLNQLLKIELKESTEENKIKSKTLYCSPMLVTVFYCGLGSVNTTCLSV